MSRLGSMYPLTARERERERERGIDKDKTIYRSIQQQTYRIHMFSGSHNNNWYVIDDFRNGNIAAPTVVGCLFVGSGIVQQCNYIVALPLHTSINNQQWWESLHFI
jgi:hypothetical protein